MTRSVPLLRARELHKTFRQDDVVVEAVRGVDLDIDRGEFVSVMGPSGSGKSTLLHLLGGLDRPTSGDVLLEGLPMSGLSRKELARVRNQRIGFVFQFFNLMPGLTAEENVALPAVIAGRPESSWVRRRDELLDLVGLTRQRRRQPAGLSGGEQQRVAIARALLMEPYVVLADEPTGNLDSKSGESVLTLLGSCHEAGQTIVLVSHDVKVAAHAERLITMRDGAIDDDTTLSIPERPRPAHLVQIGDPGEE